MPLAQLAIAPHRSRVARDIQDRVLNAALGGELSLDKHAFDVADYLVFSTRWEDALGYR